MDQETNETNKTCQHVMSCHVMSGVDGMMWMYKYTIRVEDHVMKCVGCCSAAVGSVTVCMSMPVCVVPPRARRDVGQHTLYMYMYNTGTYT